MSPVSLNKFTGIFPRTTETLLPPNAASLARNVDFTREELRSVKGHYLLKTLSENVGTVFSEDGLRFYTWPGDANAEISPIGSGDASARLYYTANGDFRVTSRSGATTSGGQPGSSFRVGVPKPTIAPTVDINSGATSVELEGITPTATFHYEYKGLKYQESPISVSTITPGKKYSFTAPARSVNVKSGATRAARLKELEYDPYTTELDDPTPADAIAVVRLIFTSTTAAEGAATGEVRLDQYSANSSLAKTTGLSIAITKDASNPLAHTLSIEDQASAEDLTTCAYCFTCVNIYNEEGAPSPATVATFSPGSKRIIGTTIPTFGEYVPLKEIRVYRTANGGASNEYFFDFAIPAIGKSGLVTGEDKTNAAALNEPLKSNFYYLPIRTLQGLVNVGNGIFAAWFGNELWFSDAYKPWSWPPSYMKSFGWPIVGVEVQGSGVLVTTLGNPYAVSGITPDSMTSDKLNVDQAGISKWSIASVGGRMVYASNDGIVTVNGGIGTLQDSEQFFTREVWRERYKQGFSTMQFAEYDGALLVFSKINAFTPFMIRLDEARGTMTELPDFIATSVFYSVATDGLYFTSGRSLYEYGGGAALALQWDSKEFQLPSPTGYSIARINCDGDFAIKFYAKDELGEMVLRHTESILKAEKSRTFRLPSGFKSDSWKFTVLGTGAFKQLLVANSGKQLAEM